MRPRVPFAARLVAAAGVLLLLPWASVPFVQRLRRGAVLSQRQALAATASRVAAALSDRPDLPLPDESHPGPVLSVPELTQPVVLDGDAADWVDEVAEPVRLPEPADEGTEAPTFSAVVRLGAKGGGVYALVEVREPRVVLRGDSTTGGDRIEIAAVSADDDLLRFEVDAPADGPVSTWLVRPGGIRLPDNRIEGAWRTAEGGYTVELRMPRTLVGSRLAIAVVHVDAEDAGGVVRLETSGMGSRDAMAAVVVPSPAVGALLAALAGPDARAWLVDPGKHVVAQGGALDRGSAGAPAALPEVWVLRALGPLSRALPPPAPAEAPLARSGGLEVDRALSGEPAGRWRSTAGKVLLSAVHPVRAGGRVRGAVLVEQTATDVADGRLARGLASFLALALAGAVLLLAFAARVSLRLRRLAEGVERLADDPGLPAAGLPERDAGDEIGDLSRGLGSLASRQREHAAYLEQVGRRLSHEMRTPVGVVRTSLDNLRLTGVPDAARVYLDRADEGVRRLSVILSRLSEATRLEQSLSATPRETYDLAPVVQGCVEGYRAARPGREIALRAPEGPLPVSGSPEMLAQLLDKLVDNALDFARPDTAVEVDMTRYGRAVALSVRNEGPPLPAEMAGRLFDSLVSVRPAGVADAVPHLGLGLSIVRLVAEFHGGSAAAHDRPDGRGVIVTVTLPLAPAY